MASYSELENSMHKLVKNFYNYAEKKGEKDKLTKREFRTMISSELNHVLTNTQSKEAADKLIKSLDADADGKISFDEYWTLINEMCMKMGQQMALNI
uniref:Protein S100 n=1 Tax=Geotrypetes seraphini TaxID=260995 RepID=A0A6P8Q1K9_GEOSA|nr:protein S100-A16-like [Geotrypetes seraphini]